MTVAFVRPDGGIRRGVEPWPSETRIMNWLARSDDIRNVRARNGLAMRWSADGDTPGEPGTAWVNAVFTAQGKTVGCFRLREFRLPPDLGDDHDAFHKWAAATHISHVAGLADAMCSGWTPAEVSAHGKLVWFERLWVEPRHARGGIWPILNAFFDKRYGQPGPGGGALMLMKPFPLEYEGAWAACSEVPRQGQDALELRRAAMRRLYAARMGVRNVGGTGWMWRPLNPEMPEPSVSPEEGLGMYGPRR